MLPEKNRSLTSYHSFASAEKTDYFLTIQHKDEIFDIVQWAHEHQLPLLVIGAGSNVLFTKDFKGVVAKMEIMGIKSWKKMRVMLY
jgi:UDP-N-acetylmuramate dehydrogenase